MTDQQRSLVEGVLERVQSLVYDGQQLHDLDTSEDASQLTKELVSLGTTVCVLLLLVGRTRPIISCTGFVENHATAAANTDGIDTLASALEWLCLTLPEADLPQAFAPGMRGCGVQCMDICVIQGFCHSFRCCW